MAKGKTKSEQVKPLANNGDGPGKIIIEGIVPPFEERLAEFQKRARELQDELQIAFVPYIKQYNTGQAVAAIDYVDRLPIPK